MKRLLLIFLCVLLVHIVVSASAEEPKAEAPVAPATEAAGGAEASETAAPASESAPAPAASGRLTADDQKAMAEALETVQRVSAKANDNGVEVSLTVKNKGERGGKTVVQVYAGAEGERARKLLKGFKKVFVPAGESVRVSLFIDKDDLKFYNPDVGDYYLAQDYTFYIGQDSQDAENKEIKINF